MARWAKVNNGVVVMVVDFPTMPGGGGWVDATGQHVGPGATYNGAVFSPAPVRKSVSQRDFWRRFTAAEREALQGTLASGTPTQKNKLNAFRDYVRTGMDVELDDDYIIASVNLMETAGILANGRAAVILG